MSELYKVLRIIFIRITTLYYCIRSGIEYDSSYQIKGCPKVNKGNFLKRLLKYPAIGGELIIGKDFKCNNKMKSNSIGLIQPCLFNILTKGSKIIIGNNVGISGSTLSAIQSITIGNNVWFGGNVVVLPNVTIGNNCVIGAGSVVTKNIPDNSLAFGNPCRVVREI